MFFWFQKNIERDLKIKRTKMEQRIVTQYTTLTDLNKKADKQEDALKKNDEKLNNVIKQHDNLTEIHKEAIVRIQKRIDELDYHIGKYLHI